MRALRRSPLFRTALLSLAVLFAHTVRAGCLQTITPAGPPCPGKVAAAQPDPEKKFTPGNKRVKPGRLAEHHNLIVGAFGLTAAHTAGITFTHHAGQFPVARWAIDVAPQRRPFALRI